MSTTTTNEHTNGKAKETNGGAKNATSPKPQTGSVEASSLLYPKKKRQTLASQPNTSELEGLVQLAPEVEEGNMEYKWKLADPTPERFEQLVSQLKWRLGEGQGEALYEIGVEDNGFLKGLPKHVLEKSIKTLERMGKELNAEVSKVCERKGKEGFVAEMLVREVHDDVYLDVRIAVCGNVDSGKSTLCGVLCRGKLDNGRGLVRINLFNHKHELETGRTSSISQRIMGFNLKGECVNYNLNEHSMTWGDIIERSCKIISFLDLAGHERYLKTTVSGMTGHMPDYCFLLVGANMGVTRMTREHLGLALALRIPLIVIVTKIDMCPEGVYKQTMSDINRILKRKGVRKLPTIIKNEDDMVTCVKHMSNDRIVPIFQISNVTGENLSLLRKFLNLVPARIQWTLLRTQEPEVLIDQTYFVTGVGTVVCGTVIQGQVAPNDTLLVGPDGNGKFVPVVIKSVHAKRVPVKLVQAGQRAGFALKKIKRANLRKGMVLCSKKLNPRSTWCFKSEVIILYHSTTIHTNYQPVVQCLTMRQSAKITAISEKDVLRTGDRATMEFQFLYRPEYLKKGMRIIFREGCCKGIGIITEVLHDKEPVFRTAATKYPQQSTAAKKAAAAKPGAKSSTKPAGKASSKPSVKPTTSKGGKGGKPDSGKASKK